MAIEVFGVQDIPQLGSLQPQEWGSITPFFKFYTDNNFCFPLKYTSGGRIVGVGTLILHQQSAWLAHIIVDTQLRGQGIGTRITRELMNAAQRSGCKTISLIASALGEPVYRKLGFTKETDYLFFKNENYIRKKEQQSVSYDARFKTGLLALDTFISGEERSKLLQPHLENSRLLFEQNELTGFYIPSLGEGPVLAKTPTAGCALLHEKHQHAQTRMVLPKENRAGVSFLLKNGFEQFLTGSRMHVGPALDTQLSNIYNRIGGNLG